MGNGSQSAEDLLQSLVFQKERVTSRYKDIPNLSMAFQIFQNLLQITLCDGPLIASNQSPSRAVSAVHGTLIGDKQQHSIRVAMHQTGHRRMVVLPQRIHHLTL